MKFNFERKLQLYVLIENNVHKYNFNLCHLVQVIINMSLRARSWEFSLDVLCGIPSFFSSILTTPGELEFQTTFCMSDFKVGFLNFYTFVALFL